MIKGINYNAGIEYDSSSTYGNKIDLSALKKDLAMIKELNCNAIRMYGSHIGKLIHYSEEALKQGFEVWISPRFIDADGKQTVLFAIEAAKKAEALRKRYKKVVFIVGNELFLDSKAIFNAPKIFNRGEFLQKYIKYTFAIKIKPDAEMKKFLSFTDKALNNLLAKLCKEVRKHFHGSITYASLSWEKVEWKLFDIVSANLYKNQWNSAYYLDELRKLKAYGKQVAITEFGVCAYKGASKLGGSAFDIVVYPEKTIKEGIVRDEQEQADYIKELLELYAKEKIAAAFVFDFKEEWKTYSDNPKKDLDLSSYGIVKVMPDGKVVPKKAFSIVKKLYSL